MYRTKMDTSPPRDSRGYYADQQFRLFFPQQDMQPMSLFIQKTPATPANCNNLPKCPILTEYERKFRSLLESNFNMGEQA